MASKFGEKIRNWIRKLEIITYNCSWLKIINFSENSVKNRLKRDKVIANLVGEIIKEFE